MKVAVVIVLDEDAERCGTHAYIGVTAKKAEHLAAKAETEILMNGMSRRMASAIVRETMDFHVAIVDIDAVLTGGSSRQPNGEPTPQKVAEDDSKPRTVVVLSKPTGPNRLDNHPFVATPGGKKCSSCGLSDRKSVV